MEKMLSKSKSRFFGKKKSSKNLGISSSDSLPTEPERVVHENIYIAPAGPMPLPLTPGTIPDSGASARVFHGPPSRLLHSGSPNIVSGRPMGLQDNGSSSSFSRPSPLGSVSESRFQVHINPTTFSPIIIPSSTPPESAASSPAKHRDISTMGTKCGVSNVEHTPHVGEGFTHGRSQSSVSPNETPNSRSRSRRHGIPANFLESVGAASGGMKNIWNGQGLGTDQYMDSQNATSRSLSPFPSQTALVHPSASAPVTSWLSNTDTGFISSELSPIHESRTDPAMFSESSTSSGRTPLPRSVPSYNLAGLTPSPSGVIDPRRTAEVGQRPAQRHQRGTLPRPPTSDASHRPRHGSPQPMSSFTPTRVSEATVIQPLSSIHHRTNPSVGSEMETGYKGLAFPLPPSTEEGLAMSYSSSQSSLYSIVSVRRSGDQLPTLNNSRDGTLRGEQERDARPSQNTDSRAVIPSPGKSIRERNPSIGMTESRASPIPNARLTKRQLDGAIEDSESAQTNGPNTDGPRDIKRHDRVGKRLENVLGVRSQQDELPKDTNLPIRIRAVSEAPRHHPAGARLQMQHEPTKPLILNSSRKALHTTRSFTTLTERKQVHASSSTRNLVGAYNNVDGDRVRAATPSSVRIRPGVQLSGVVTTHVSVAPIQAQHFDDQSIPPSFPLPTPPNSTSAISLLDKTKNTEEAPSHPQASIVIPPAQSLTLEEVTEALRAQHIRFDELSGHVLDVAQRHIAEKNAHVERVGRLEGTVAKLEREIRGLRWLVLENTKVRGGTVSGAGLIFNAAAEEEDSGNKKRGETNNESIVGERTLRRSSTMPHIPTFGQKPGHARNKRFGGLGLDFSPESIGSSPITLSSLATPSRFEVDIGDEEQTPSMDEIIDKLMAVRQWAGSDVRVSVIESTGGAGESKRIVFRQV